MIEEGDERRLFRRGDRILLLVVCLELACFVAVPFGPLVVAAIGTTTSIRQSRARLVGIWLLASSLTVIVVAPYLAAFFGLQSADLGPTQVAP